MLSLTNYPLFEDLTSLIINGENIDFHNEYIVSHLKYEKETNLLNMTLTPNDKFGSEKNRYGLTFEEVVVMKLDLVFDKTYDSYTINNFYRGRFEKEGKAIEFSLDGSSYFYVEFENGNSFEAFAKNVKLYEI